MYCSNCGEKLSAKDIFCSKCGTAVNGAEKVNTTTNVTPGKGKSVASMVLGILGVVFGVLYLVSVTDIGYYESQTMSVNTGYQFGYAIGSILIPIVFAIISICLAVSARKISKNGQNTAGFWLSIVTFVICAIIFIIVLSI